MTPQPPIRNARRGPATTAARSLARSLDALVDRTCQLDPRMARVRFLHRLAREDGRRAELPVLVFQMGKVGSTAVTRSLRRAFAERSVAERGSPPRRVYHVHQIAGPAAPEPPPEDLLRTPHEHRLLRAWRDAYLLDWIERERARRWQVVTIVRDPMARNLSAFFQGCEVAALEGGRWQFRSERYGVELVVAESEPGPLLEAFVERFPHERPLDFFDTQLAALFGIDVFAQPFPREAGWAVCRSERCETLLLRLEDLREAGPSALGRRRYMDQA